MILYVSIKKRRVESRLLFSSCIRVISMQSPSTSPTLQSSRHNLAVAVALCLVYVVWGTTYFAIDVVIQSMPPMLMNGTRFVLAGAIMMVVALLQGQRLPTRREWVNAALIGGLMVFAALNLVSYAQKLGIGSGLMATVVTTMPMWLALWTRLGGESVPRTSWLGLAVGVVGAMLLSMEGDFNTTLTGTVLAFAAPLAWSIGSYASRKLAAPPPVMAASAQWLAGGAIGLCIALPFESTSAMLEVTPTAWAGWVYLVFIGTLIALNAYMWLLKNTSPALAGSYAFVNPAVALLVGVVLGGEALTGWVYLALPLILLALALIMYGNKVLSWLKAR